MALDCESILRRNASVLSQAVDQDLVILPPAHDHYVGLDEIGRRIWELLEVPRSIGEICLRLSEEFNAAPEQIASDTLPFLSELLQEDLLHVVGQQRLA